MWSAQVWLTTTPTFGTWFLSSYIPLNGAAALTVAYIGYYIILNTPLGLMIAPVLFGLLYGAVEFAKISEFPLGLNAMSVATAIHVASWFFQIGILR